MSFFFKELILLCFVIRGKKMKTEIFYRRTHLPVPYRSEFLAKCYCCQMSGSPRGLSRQFNAWTYGPGRARATAGRMQITAEEIKVPYNPGTPGGQKRQKKKRNRGNA